MRIDSNNLVFENVNCIICNNKNFDKLFTKKILNYNFNIVKCKCSLVLLNPRPSKKTIKAFYLIDYLPHNFNSMSYLLKNIQKKIFNWKKNIVNKYNFSGKKVLDIGYDDSAKGFDGNTCSVLASSSICSWCFDSSYKT